MFDQLLIRIKRIQRIILLTDLGWKYLLVFYALIFALTLLTQIGGIVLWLVIVLTRPINFQSKRYQYFVPVFAFFTLYLIFIAFLVPAIAPLFGRVALPWGIGSGSDSKPANIGFCLLGRNYVDVKLYKMLERVAKDFHAKYPDRPIIYLDAGFPFLNGFPLLPHLSHSQGKSIDIAFYNVNPYTGFLDNGPPSPFGYWAFVEPRSDESRPCRGTQSRLRWDMKWLQGLIGEVELDRERTRSLVEEFIQEAEVKKIFIEPHLKERMGLDSSKVRFQGCHAARHDDHFHVEVY